MTKDSQPPYRAPAAMGSGALQGELSDEAGGRWTIKVWDLGEGGACVFTQPSIDTLGSGSLQLTIFDRYLCSGMG